VKGAQEYIPPPPEKEDPKDDGEKRTQAERLTELAQDEVGQFFHDHSGDAYAVVLVNGHREVLELRRKGFRSLLYRLYYREYRKPPSSQAVLNALGTLEAFARFDGPERPVFTRLAKHEDRFYLDLGNDAWEVVEITPTGWRVLTDSPVMFRRSKGLKALPTPVSGGSMGELWDYLNAPPAERPLVLAFLMMCLNPDGPYPLLVLIAEQGSGKSTQARVLRELIDPNKAPLRSAPRDDRDLIIAATNSWLPVFDNLSHLSPNLSDALCRLSTGGGYATRELYSDSDETILEAMRPVILTGIDDLATRADLLDRAIILNLPRIKPEDRRTEKELFMAFKAAKPRLLGALLDAVVTGLRNLPTTKVKNVPRMADFATWATACEASLGLEPGAILTAYRENRANANTLALDVSPLPGVLKEFMGNHTEWEGSPSDLLSLLDGVADDAMRRSKAWPKSASSLSNKLRRLAPNLREAGIDLEFTRINRERLIRISLQDAVTAVTPSPAPQEVRPARQDAGDGVGDALVTASSLTETPSPLPSPQKTRPGRNGDGGDASDGVLRPHSNDTQQAEEDAPLPSWDEV